MTQNLVLKGKLIVHTFETTFCVVAKQGVSSLGHRLS